MFDDYPSLKAAIDDDDLDVTADHVLVLRNAGPQGGPGMPEWGMLPIPSKLVKQGVRDMLRISDARMSGTSYGACILHVSPESYVGGPLALVQTGDLITLDVAAPHASTWTCSDAELAARRAAWNAPEPRYERGYGWMFTRHIQQAHEGCDFDFLETEFGAPVDEPVDLLSEHRMALIDRNPRQAQDRRAPPRCAPRSSSAACATSSSRTCARSIPPCRTWSARPSRCATSRRART